MNERREEKEALNSLVSIIKHECLPNDIKLLGNVIKSIKDKNKQIELLTKSHEDVCLELAIANEKLDRYIKQVKEKKE